MVSGLTTTHLPTFCLWKNQEDFFILKGHHFEHSSPDASNSQCCCDLQNRTETIQKCQRYFLFSSKEILATKCNSGFPQKVNFSTTIAQIAQLVSWELELKPQFI